MNREQGLSVVTLAVADCLGLSPEEVHPESRLVTDLGASSLDILDLVFTLEQKLGVKLRDGELDALLRGELVTEAQLQDGFLVPEALARLEGFLPALRALPEPRKLAPAAIIPLFTVESMWLLVERRMG
jgi:acyl carrier protein